VAEQATTNAGLDRAAELGYGGKDFVSWMWTVKGWDDTWFTVIGNAYRSAGGNVCPHVSCSTFLGGFFDPRKTWPPGFPPVGYAERLVYGNDGVGALITGH